MGVRKSGVGYIQENPSVYEWGGKIEFMVKREKNEKRKA